MSHPKNALAECMSASMWPPPRSGIDRVHCPTGSSLLPGQFSRKEATLLASVTLEELCLRVNWMRMEACRMVSSVSPSAFCELGVTP